MQSSLKNNYRSFILNFKYRSSTVLDRETSDVYLVEYPKSGVTYLSTILANIRCIEQCKRCSVNFSNVGRYVHDLHFDKQVGRQVTSDDFGRLIKSHATFNPSYKTVVYLIRNPLNVMKSFYFYNSEVEQKYKLNKPTGTGQRNEDFLSFVESNVGLTAWTNHVKSWSGKKASGQKTFFLRYEELLSDPFEAISQVCQLIGWKVSEKSIFESIEASSIPNMQENEKLLARYNPFWTGKFVKKRTETHVNYSLPKSEELRKILDAFGYD